MKKIAGIIASWLAVLLVCYGAVEVTALHWLPRVFPLASVMNYLDQDAQLQAQYSKNDVIPERYVAILGDSYAFGQGDWLFNRQSDVMPVYNTTHLLHEKTGRDVVSFGRPASSSIKAYLEDPLSQLQFIRRRDVIADPDVAVLYFYEGNDAVDNWQEYQMRYLQRGYSAERLQDAEYFARFIDEAILAQNNTVQRAIHPAWSDVLPAGRFFLHLLLGESSRIASELQQQMNPKPHRPIFKPQPRDHNTVRVAGVEQRIPDGLQVPPLALQDDELTISLRIFTQSLEQLQQRWPNTRIGVIYVPAVATVYDVVSPTVNIYDTERGKNYPTERILPRSDATCSLIRQSVASRGLAFVDARPALRAAAQQQFLHGPVDWLHFNERGYRLLADEIGVLLQQIEQRSPAAVCARLTP